MGDVRVHRTYEWNDGRIEEVDRTYDKERTEREVALDVRLIDMCDHGGLKSLTIRLENVT